MPFPVTINGRTWQKSHFDPFDYATNFADFAYDVATAGGQAEAARANAEAAYAALLTSRLPVLAVSGAASLGFASHNNRVLLCNGSGTITVPWAATGDGFACIIVNRRTTALLLAATGATLLHPDSHVRVRPNGIAMLMAIADGATGLLQLAGQTEA